MIFNNKGISDYFQARCIVIGVTEEQVADTFIFETSVPCPGQMPCSYALDYHAPGLIHKGLVHASEPNARWVVEPKVKLVYLCVKAELVPSKNEFRRKCEQKGLTYNGKPITDFNMEIDATKPDINHEVRLGKRFLEIVVPSIYKGEEDALLPSSS